MLLSDVCLTSVAYIGNNSRTEIGLGRPKLAHMTHDSDTTFKVKRSRSPGRFTHRGVYTQAAAEVSVGTY